MTANLGLRPVSVLATYVWPIRKPMPRAWWSMMMAAMPLLLALLPPHRSAVATIRKPMRVLITAPPMEQPRAAGGSGKAAVRSKQKAKTKSAAVTHAVTTLAPTLNVDESFVVAPPPPPPDAAEEVASTGVGSGGSESGFGHGQGEGTGIGDGDEGGKAAKKLEKKVLPPQPRSRTWSCEWPLLTKVRDATVLVKVAVDEHGYPEEVAVVHTTHDDFIKTTVECAMNKRYHPARDETGKAIPGVTDAWPVHYILYGSEVEQ